MKSDELLVLLKDKKKIFIQTHDYPDPDAVAAAFGLQYFLKEAGITARILYEGELQTNPIEKMVAAFGIEMHSVAEVTVEHHDSIIVVDGCVGNTNMTESRGEIVAVLDHHQAGDASGIPFADIRIHYGASSTIIAEYFQEQNVMPTSAVATALAIGIHTDTNSFRRRTSAHDLRAYSFLFPQIDQVLMSGILRNNVQQGELALYQKAMGEVSIEEGFAFYYYPDQCPQNALGILADFLLGVEEIECVVVCAQNGERIIFSMRSERAAWNAGHIIKDALQGVGSGGGHKDMAGGSITNASQFDAETLRQRFKKIVKGGLL